jgi:glycosyltransferase involved in cell wall biosynthesis
MACPVIATNIGAPPETVAAAPNVPPGEITGWLVPPGDAATLADTMAEALSLSPGARAALGARARARALGRFGLDSMRRETLDVYDRLLGTGLAAAYG